MNVTIRSSHAVLAFCVCLTFAAPANLLFAKDSIQIYTSAPDPSEKNKSVEQTMPGQSFVAKGTSRVPAAPLPFFCLSLEPKGKATASQNSGSGGVTHFGHWKQSGGQVVVTFNADDHMRPMTFSRSGNKVTANGWESSSWGGAPAPAILHRESTGDQNTAQAGHSGFFHF